MKTVEYIRCSKPDRDMKRIAQTISEALEPNLERVEIRLLRDTGVDPDTLKEKLQKLLNGRSDNLRLRIRQSEAGISEAAGHTIEFTFADRFDGSATVESPFAKPLAWAQASRQAWRDSRLEEKRNHALVEAVTSLARTVDASEVTTARAAIFEADSETTVWLEGRAERLPHLLRHALPGNLVTNLDVRIHDMGQAESPIVALRLQEADDDFIQMPPQIPPVHFPKSVEVADMSRPGDADTQPLIEKEKNMAKKTTSLEARNQKALHAKIVEKLDFSLSTPGVIVQKVDVTILDQKGIDADEVREFISSFLAKRYPTVNLSVKRNEKLDVNLSPHLLWLMYDPAGAEPRFEPPSLRERLLETVNKLRTDRASLALKLRQQFARPDRDQIRLVRYFQGQVAGYIQQIDTLLAGGSVIDEILVRTSLRKLYNWLQEHQDDAGQILRHQLGLKAVPSLRFEYHDGTILPGEPSVSLVFNPG